MRELRHVVIMQLAGVLLIRQLQSRRENRVPVASSCAPAQGDRTGKALLIFGFDSDIEACIFERPSLPLRTAEVMGMSIAELIIFLKEIGH